MEFQKKARKKRITDQRQSRNPQIDYHFGSLKTEKYLFAPIFYLFQGWLAGTYPQSAQ